MGEWESGREGGRDLEREREGDRERVRERFLSSYSRLTSKTVRPGLLIPLTVFADYDEFTLVLI